MTTDARANERSASAIGGGVGSVYDFWLGLLPQFFAQLGAPQPAAGAGTLSAAAPALPFPADQVAKAAAMTQSALQSLAQAYVPLLQAAGTQGLLGQWTMPSASIAYDRTFGAVSDALGFGPMRKLQSAAQDLLAASLEQNGARTRYAMLVQRAFTAGFDVLLERLAEMAKAGERIDSVLALLRLWAVATEQAVHEVLQSEQGLEATAAIARAGLAHRRKIQHVASLVADTLDMATRRDLDEAFREIQALKRELRALRNAAPPAKSSLPAKPAAAKSAPPRKRAPKRRSTP